MAPQQTCPSRAEWQEFLDGQRSGAFPGDCSNHLESCPPCQKLLDELTGGDRAWERIAGELRRQAPFLPPAYWQALAALPKRVPSLIRSPNMTACIHIERMPHRNSMAVAGESAVSYVLLKLIPTGLNGSARPLGLNLALALDISGSMYEEDSTGSSRLKRVQNAACSAI